MRGFLCILRAVHVRRGSVAPTLLPPLDPLSFRLREVWVVHLRSFGHKVLLKRALLCVLLALLFAFAQGLRLLFLVQALEVLQRLLLLLLIVAALLLSLLLILDAVLLSILLALDAVLLGLLLILDAVGLSETKSVFPFENN